MAFVERDECISIFSLYISFFFISFLDFMSRIAVIWISSPELSMFVTLMPCLYVLLCGPKNRNKDSCFSSSCLETELNPDKSWSILGLS